MPDGENFRASGVLILSPTGNQFLTYQSLNYPAVTTPGEKGLLAGSLTFTEGMGTIDVHGTLEWVKPAQNKGTYKAAIDTNLTVTGALSP